MKLRRRARAMTLQVLYEVDLAGHDAMTVLNQRQEETRLPPDALAFAKELVCGTLANKAVLDKVIARIAPEWPVEQMACIDRNILRMALYELSNGETPVKVVINEAVELAKVFGSESSRRFVNGALGTFVAKQMWIPIKEQDEKGEER